MRDFEEAGVAAGEVFEDALFVHGWDDVEAAVFEGGVDEGDPAGDDEMAVAVGEGIAGVLVPGDFAAVPAGQFGADAVDGGADDVGADEALDAGEESRVANRLQHGGTVVASAAFAHDLAGDFFAGGRVFGMNTGQALSKGQILMYLRQLAFCLQGAGCLIDDLGQRGLQRFQVLRREKALFEQKALAMELS